MPDEKTKEIKKNSNNLPVIKETSLHRIVERVKNKDNTLLTDPLTNKPVITSEYLDVDKDKKGKVTKIIAKKRFYWDCWDFEQDIEPEDINIPIKIIRKENEVKYENFKPDKRQENKGYPFVVYDFEIDFSAVNVEIDSVYTHLNYQEKNNIQYYQNKYGIYFSEVVNFNKCSFINGPDFRSVQFSGAAKFFSAQFSDGANFTSAQFSGEACFISAQFSDGTGFVSTQFLGKADFDYAQFSGAAYFISAQFSGAASFSSVQFSDAANFSSVQFSDRADFRSAQFSGETIFYFTQFSGEADFSSTKFSDIFSLFRVILSDELSFEYALFRRELKMVDIQFKQKKPLISLYGCTIEDRIFLGLNEDHNNAYKALTLQLYGSNIAYFVCDDKAFEQVKLYWHKPFKDWDKRCDNKTKTERYIHELRIMRKIFQDLLWGDIADEYYAKLMEQQKKLEILELKEDFKKLQKWKTIISLLTLISIIILIHYRFYYYKSVIVSYLFSFTLYIILNRIFFNDFYKIVKSLCRNFFIKTLLYDICFGWGVRLERIFITGIVTILVFALIYHFLFLFQDSKIIYNFNNITSNIQKPVDLQKISFPSIILFSAWNFFNIFLPDPQIIPLKSALAVTITIESLLGIIWITLLVAILSRKFMRL